MPPTPLTQYFTRIHYYTDDDSDDDHDDNDDYSVAVGSAKMLNPAKELRFIRHWLSLHNLGTVNNL